MDDRDEYVLDVSMQYSDIIVPTVDTVRASYLIELLLTNEKQVQTSCTVRKFILVCIHVQCTCTCICVHVFLGKYFMVLKVIFSHSGIVCWSHWYW